MKKSGVYMITCAANQKRYIGSSRNMQKRKWEHWYHLKAQCHHNLHMQAIYNKYGKSSLKFEVLEIASYNELILKEQSWIDNLKPEINKALTATSGFLGQKHTEESKMKMSIAHKKRLENPELRERLRQAAIEQHKRQPNNMKGKKQSKEMKEHLRHKTLNQFSTREAREQHSQIMKEWMTDEMRQRISQSKIGKKQSKETKEKRTKILQSVWDNYSPQERKSRIEKTKKATVQARAKHYNGFLSPNGIEYENIHNLAEFCRNHSLLTSKMCLLNQGKIKQHKGWKLLE